VDQVRSPLAKKAGHPDKPGQPASPAHYINRNAVLFEFAREAGPVMENGHRQLNTRRHQVGSHVDE
jgi:hypothetical protein